MTQIEEIRGLLPRCMLYDWVRLGSRLARVLRDRHHADRHDAVLVRLLERARASAALREWRAAHRPRVTYPPELPIAARKDEILELLRKHQVIVVAGETGSGKTTQIPKICLEAGLGVEARIGCTQPRRVAALSVSRRIAEELGVPWGREVGSKIRFDDRTSPQTFIKMVTDGMLLAELQDDPLLSDYNAIVIDEAHERSLNIDFLLGHLKGLLARRDDLKLVITSATIDTAAFSRAFNNAPVVEVSGRMYPVEVVYEPLDAIQEEEGERTYVDAAVQVAERILQGGAPGDILIFMPTERDIREAADRIEHRAGGRAQVIPLFGRLSSDEQQRVFTSGGPRKVVVATNIAETSLTIPGIRYVIDSGFARVSRYNPRTRTRRLPIEPISKSSANQRKGRAGRVEAGVCIRLYSEDDFNARPEFTQPEIQRSNLAEVILRMKAFHLGDVETFPFLNPPSPAAIQAGYALLHELGAIDEKRELTPLGRDLARLPIDPTLGRMLLQSQREHATRELLIIAAGLSIQDPRERPLDQQAAADAAHRRHAHPRSDFLTLLNLWNAVHDEWESLRTQNQRRKFCRRNFLSYTRMREWQDLHAQLADALEDLGPLTPLREASARRSEPSPHDGVYEAVHRSILAGLLAHIARREDRNQYRGLGNRLLSVFPGSVLHERGAGSSPGRKAQPADPRQPKTRQPQWIVAGEIVETSSVFARTLAGIDPRWVVELAPHLCRKSYVNPRWSPSAGRVLIEEITSISGLELQRRRVDYGQLEPEKATEIFIRAALVEEQLLVPADPDGDAGDPHEAGGRRKTGRWRAPSLAAATQPRIPEQYAFLEHNRRVRERIESWRTRMRRHDLRDIDDALRDFYAARLKAVSSRDALNRWIREHDGPRALFATEDDLAAGQDIRIDRAAFPDTIEVAGQPVRLAYAYAPGEEHDGVTVRVPFTLADAVSPALIEWAVPGLREAKAEELLRALPKSIRSQLQPIAPKAAEIARDFQPGGPSLLHDLALFIERRYGVRLTAAAWQREALPPHLRSRVELIGPDEKPVAAGRDLAALKEQLRRMPKPAAGESGPWRAAREKWERYDLSGWTFGDLPERIALGGAGGIPEYAWPGLEREGDLVHLKLFTTQPSARAATRTGLPRLVELALQKDVAWLRKELRSASRSLGASAGAGTPEEFEEDAWEHLRRHVFETEPPAVLSEAEFRERVEKARERLAGLPGTWLQRVRQILEVRARITARLGLSEGVAPAAAKASAPRVLKDLSQLGSLADARPAAPGAKGAGASVGPGRPELEQLAPSRFLRVTPCDRIEHLPRYLRALEIRMERAALNPPKDRERALLVAPYVEALAKLRTGPASEEKRNAIEAFRWMIEEFRVSLFAQELGTSQPVSAKRLDAELERLRFMS